MWPHGQQPTRLLHPWDLPGKSTGVGCHRLLCMYHLVITFFCMVFLKIPSRHFTLTHLTASFVVIFCPICLSKFLSLSAMHCSESIPLHHGMLTVITLYSVFPSSHRNPWILWGQKRKERKECEVTQSCPTLKIPWTVGSSVPGSSVHGIFQVRVLEGVAISFSRGSSWSWNFPGKSIRVGIHFLPTQGSNSGLPHCGQMLYHLSHLGSPWRQKL